MLPKLHFMPKFESAPRGIGCAFHGEGAEIGKIISFRSDTNYMILLIYLNYCQTIVSCISPVSIHYCLVKNIVIDPVCVSHLTDSGPHVSHSLRHIPQILIFSFRKNNIAEILTPQPVESRGLRTSWLTPSKTHTSVSHFFHLEK